MFSKVPGRNISEGSIEATVIELAQRYGKSLCIDIGSGDDKNNSLRQEELIQTLDTREEFEPDYLGDIRTIFVPDDPDKPTKINESLLSIRKNHYMLIKLQHVVEHIEWIYQEFLYRWIMDLLAPGGVVYIATPNLEYALGVYYVNRKKQIRGKEVKYPIDEHIYFKPGVTSDMQRWVNFKLFSGCSPGDYHHCCYDRQWLGDMLLSSGFDNISIHDGSTLKAIAYKPGMQQFDVSEAIKRVTE